MLQTDPIVLKYPHFLPKEEEVDAAIRLLEDRAELKKTLTESVCIGGCERSAIRRFCWQAREEHKFGDACAHGAVEWLLKCVAARAKLQMDSLLWKGPFDADFRAKYLAAMPFSVHGLDKQGHPVMIARYGSVDLQAFRALWEEGEALQKKAGLAVNACVLFHLRAMEYVTKIVMAEESKRQGRVVDRILLIMDMNGISLKVVNSPLKAFLGAVSKESVPLFPETLHATVLANVPWVVSRAAWPIVKTFLHPVTQDKFMISSSAAELKSKLLELMDVKDIPPYFGGSCCCAECKLGTLRGGSLWQWEESQGLFCDKEKEAPTTEGPLSSPSSLGSPSADPQDGGDEGCGFLPSEPAADHIVRSALACEVR